MIDSQPKANLTNNDSSESYKEGSLTLLGAVSMGTGVMIGAGIFALTGQVAELWSDLRCYPRLAVQLLCL